MKSSDFVKAKETKQESLQNKSFADSSTAIYDTDNIDKKAKFDCSNLTVSANRSFIFPDKSGTLATIDDTGLKKISNTVTWSLRSFNTIGTLNGVSFVIYCDSSNVFYLNTVPTINAFIGYYSKTDMSILKDTVYTWATGSTYFLPLPDPNASVGGANGIITVASDNSQTFIISSIIIMSSPRSLKITITAL